MHVNMFKSLKANGQFRDFDTQIPIGRLHKCLFVVLLFYGIQLK